jgi:hypothetical protein
VPRIGVGSGRLIERNGVKFRLSSFELAIDGVRLPDLETALFEPLFEHSAYRS